MRLPTQRGSAEAGRRGDTPPQPAGHLRARTPPVTARRNLVQRIANLLRKAADGELALNPWQLSQVREAIEHLEEERFAEGERTMSEAERADLYDGIWSTSWPPWLRPHRPFPWSDLGALEPPEGVLLFKIEGGRATLRMNMASIRVFFRALKCRPN